MYSPAITIKILNVIVQYLILFKAATDFGEKILFCRIYPSNLKALNNPIKKAIDVAYTYNINGSKYTLNKSMFTALPSVRGNRIKKANTTIPISMIIIWRNNIKILFIVVYMYCSARSIKLILKNSNTIVRFIIQDSSLIAPNFVFPFSFSQASLFQSITSNPV